MILFNAKCEMKPATLFKLIPHNDKYVYFCAGFQTKIKCPQKK
jgi:hypothetical protein